MRKTKESCVKLIKDIIDECCLKGDFTNIKELDMPFDNIIENINNIDVGRFYEFVFKNGSFIRTKTITSKLDSNNMVMYQKAKTPGINRHEPCTSFNFKSGTSGTSFSFGADIIFKDDKNKIVWGITSKSSDNITAGKTEWRQMLNLNKNPEFQGLDVGIGCLIKDKSNFRIPAELKSFKHYIFDENDLRSIWEECRVAFNNSNWDLSKIEESIQEKRMPVCLYPHQKEGIEKAFNFFNKKISKDFLFFWKCRSGKSLAALCLFFCKNGTK